ncbi:MAG: HD domain-containing protein [Solirubrobacteraceae bacterium]|nr:HD domain-containing protein [Solirubrobacteraceae bacterium]
MVGGAVRDLASDRPVADLDLAVTGDVREAARRLADAAGGPLFRLSEEFGAWRVLAADRSWHADLNPLRGDTIQDDLAVRDLTINAMALPLDGGDRIDPFGGAADLASGVLRAVGPASLSDDPLRVMRIARMATELGLVPDQETVELARASAPQAGVVAQERVFAELRRILAAEDPVVGVRWMDELGLLDAVLPELVALRGVEQSHYHHLDVFDHTLAVLDQAAKLRADPAGAFGAEIAPEIDALLTDRLSDDADRGVGLMLGALLHDIAKPQTQTDFGDGRVGFPDHDRQGAEMTRAVLARLRVSDKMRGHVAGLTRHHLRLGFLVHHQPLSRAQVYRYLAACGPVSADVTVLSVADRLATRGRKAEEAIAKHVTLARELIVDALAWHRDGPPPQVIRGDELARELGEQPGPWLGELLDGLAEARFAGEVTTREQAIAWARERRSEAGR